MGGTEFLEATTGTLSAFQILSVFCHHQEMWQLFGGQNPLETKASLESFLLPPICYLRTHLLGLPCHLDVKIVIVFHEKMKDFMAHLLVF